MSEPFVLVLSSPRDYPACLVVDALQHRNIPVLLLDSGDFPLSLTLDATFVGGKQWDGWLLYQGERYDLTSIMSVLYRRPTHYVVDQSLPPQIQRFAEDEATNGFGGWLRGLPAFWISHPDALRSASFKPRQLQIASSLGLRTPRSLLTNSPDALLRFFEMCDGQVICKTLARGNIAVDKERYDAIFTSMVTSEHLKESARVRHTAHLFQEVIEKECELRVTVVGDRVFPAAIYAQHSEAARLDFRNAYGDLRYGVYDLPPAIEEACLRVVRAYG